MFINYFLYWRQPENWDPNLNWAGLANWIPMFALYLGSQKYLKIKKKKICSNGAFIRTLLVVFSCLSQYFLNWYGPYELLNGLIIWYQRPIIIFISQYQVCLITQIIQVHGWQ